MNDDLFAENNWNSINHRLELGFESYEEFVSIDDEIMYRQELTDEQWSFWQHFIYDSF